MDKNIFIVTFATESDKLRVLDGKTWLFANNWFSLQDLNGLNQISSKQFNTETLWIQLHNLPFRLRNRFYGNRIGGTVGKVLDVDVDEDDMG